MTDFEFITQSGYKEYSSKLNHLYERTFQKTIRSSEGKRFLEIHRWEPLRNDLQVAYEVGATFETCHGAWVTLKFYSLTWAELQKNLTFYETEIGHVFRLLGGEVQT